MKAREYLDGAKTLAEIAGRSLALIAMARFADEAAVANSHRSFYELHVAANGLPWGSDVLELIDAVASERLPEHLTHRARDEVPPR